MFYRRKLILSLLEELGGNLTLTQLQKYLFLATRIQKSQSFDFVPYRYGCFSFQANQDISTMIKLGFLSQKNNRVFLEDGKNYYSELSSSDQCVVKEIKYNFGRIPTKDLIRHIYVKYPFFAIKSTIAEKILSKDEQRIVCAQNTHFDEQKLFTLGYEGKSIEHYLNILIKNDIRVLCDVRKNAFSQKYGFSKSQLGKFCSGLNIKYIHLPELGIESNMRHNLINQSDYDSLFEYYEKNTLPKRIDCLIKLRDIISQEGRIALTCFEQNPKQCHRSKVAEALMNMKNVDYSFEDIL